MTEKKLSRRDAIKLLGAALGGAALATVPPEWSKPALAASQLPEHARQSVSPAPGPYGIQAGADLINIIQCQAGQMVSVVQIDPPDLGVDLHFDITIIAPVKVFSPLSGTVTTNGKGAADVTIQAASSGGGSLTVKWSFVDSVANPATDSQTFFGGPNKC